jgi:hypothetical protein
VHIDRIFDRKKRNHRHDASRTISEIKSSA